MNALLKQTLEEHAESGPAPHLDPAVLEELGRQRVRRRRLAGGAGALALVAVLGVAAPFVLGGAGADRGQVAVDPAASVFAEPAVSWSVGTVVHVGDRELELPREPVAYVLTDAGIVWSDAEGGVNLTTDDGTQQVGVTTVEDGRVLVADGSFAAWYDGDEASFTVVDTTTGTVARQVPVTLDGPQDGEFDGPSVRALDDGVLWSFADREVTGVEVESGDTVDSAGVTGSEDLADVRGGWLALALRSLQDVSTGDLDVAGIAVRSVDGENRGDVPGDDRALLSPDARYVATDPNDSEQVWDVATGEDVTPDLGPYGFMAVAQWLDTDRFQALAFPRADLQSSGSDSELSVDMLVCSVDAGSCEVAAADVGTLGDLQLPIGENLGE